MPSRQIYLLSARELPPETIAVAFAKTSRSPQSFREIAAELSDHTSAEFHEKWVVGYGHASVAEHAVLHLALENISRLAVECLESNRLASFTEKSTRYQKWNVNDFYIPVELEGQRLLGRMFNTCQALFQAYVDSLAPLRRLVEAEQPRKPEEGTEAYDRRVRSLYIDSCRYLLPAAALANVGMTANARVLENAIRKMLSHPLDEVRAIGQEMRRAALKEVPTLVKYAEPVPYLETSTHELAALGSRVEGLQSRDWCTLVDVDPEGELKVLAAALFRFGEMPYENALRAVRAASAEGREQMAAALLGKLDLHDVPLRELEHTTYTFELVLDQGAWVEFKRHRMMTQTTQPLTTCLGYAVPRRFQQAGIEGAYHEAMRLAADAYTQLARWNPHVASYVVPNGFNRRVLFTMNLRQAFAFCQLRAAPGAHFAIRRAARRIAEEIRLVHPLLMRYMRLPDNETWQSIEERYL